MDFPLIQAERKDGDEPFVGAAGVRTELRLVDFWRWSTSDLLVNTTRAVLAEFLVGSALGCAQGVREEWAPYDLETAEGVSVEVKSSAYVQSWAQRALSQVKFDISPRQAWDKARNEFAGAPKRHARVYVFCLLAHRDKATIDPMNLDQWRFYVLPTATLDAARPSQQSLGLSSLEALEPRLVPWEGLREAVARCAKSDAARR